MYLIGQEGKPEIREKRMCSEMENWSYRMKSCHLTERDLLYQEVDRCYLNKI